MLDIREQQSVQSPSVMYKIYFAVAMLHFVLGDMTKVNILLYSHNQATVLSSTSAASDFHSFWVEKKIFPFRSLDCVRFAFFPCMRALVFCSLACTLTLAFLRLPRASFVCSSPSLRSLIYHSFFLPSAVRALFHQVLSFIRSITRALFPFTHSFRHSSFIFPFLFRREILASKRARPAKTSYLETNRWWKKLWNS